MTTDGRVTVVELPYVKPGQCTQCGSPGGDGRKFIDMGTNIVRYGKIYFCEYCFNEAAHVLGFMGPANWETLAMQNETYREEIDQLKEENAKLSAAVGGSIPKLIADLSNLLPSQQGTKRSPGRPKKAEQQPTE